MKVLQVLQDLTVFCGDIRDPWGHISEGISLYLLIFHSGYKIRFRYLTNGEREILNQNGGFTETLEIIYIRYHLRYMQVTVVLRHIPA